MRRSVRRGGVAFLAVAPVAVWLSAWSVEEARFSPFTLEYQKRKSLVVFTGELALYQSKWEPASNEVLAYITQKKFVQPIAADDPQWNLVHRFKQGRHGGWQRAFRCLHPDLIVWSDAHPNVAPLYWQVGCALVRSDSEKEIDAGYELLGRGWEYCETASDLRKLVKLLERTYQIDIMSKAPAALSKVKIVPSKSAMSAPRNAPTLSPEQLKQFKQFEAKNGSRTEPAPPAPPASNPPAP